MTATLKNIALIAATASGKSSLAMAIASRAGAEILSVDSMQVYRGMNIGTAKPTFADQQRVRHHAIDVVEPNTDYSVANFVNLADATIADAKRRNIPLIITGGTPMYFKALFEGLFEGPSADAALRARLNDLPLDELHAKLSAIDPAAGLRIHINDRRRMVRALEVFEITGQSISSLQTTWSDTSPPRHDVRWFGLDWDRDELNRRINARVKVMVGEGWLAEAKSLLDKFGALSKTAGEATGYASLFAHLRGDCSFFDSVEQIKIDTRQLARRQMKWFRRFANVTWLDGRLPLDELTSEVLRVAN